MPLYWRENRIRAVSVTLGITIIAAGFYCLVAVTPSRSGLLDPLRLQPINILTLFYVTACNSNCYTCQQTVANCTSCAATPSNRLLPDCSCPFGTFDTNQPICPSCDWQCFVCTGSPANCQQCQGDRVNPPQCNCPLTNQYSDPSFVDCQNCSADCLQCVWNGQSALLTGSQCTSCVANRVPIGADCQCSPNIAFAVSIGNTLKECDSNHYNQD